MQRLNKLHQQLSTTKVSNERKAELAHICLRDPEVHSECVGVLSRLSRYNSHDIKMVLIAWVVSAHPEALLDDSDNTHHVVLVAHAQCVARAFRNLVVCVNTADVTCNTVDDALCAGRADSGPGHGHGPGHGPGHGHGHGPDSFRRELDAFIGQFGKWQCEDKQKLIYTLVRSYINIDDTSKVVHLPSSDVMKNKLRARARGLGCDDHVFESCVHRTRASHVAQRAADEAQRAALEAQCMITKLTHTSLDSTDICDTTTSNTTHLPPSPQEETIDMIVHRAFWDAFVHRLNAGHVDQLQLLLEELSQKLKRLTPSRHDIHQRIDEWLDVSLVVQMVQHHALDRNDLVRVTHNVIQHVIQMQAPIHNTGTKKWYATWKCEVEACEDTTMRARHLATFLQHTHTDIDTIMFDLQKL